MNKIVSFVLALLLCLAVGCPVSAAAQAQSDCPAIATNNAIIVSNSLTEPDAHRVYPSVYKIDGANYFKLRDVAMLLNGSSNQFAVDYDEETGAVKICTGKRYTSVGSEMTGVAAKNRRARISSNTIIIDGNTVTMTVYVIDGYNYFRLRDLGKALNFYIGYNDTTKTVLISGAKGYSEAEEIVEGSIAFSAQRIRVQYGESAPGKSQIWITSTTEFDNLLKAYQNKNADKLAMYDENFFAEHNLILVVMIESSGSVAHEVREVQVEASVESDLPYTIRPVIMRICPDVGTCDMAQWYILIAVDKMYGPGNCALADASPLNISNLVDR